MAVVISLAVVALLGAGAVILFAYLSPERDGAPMEESPWQAFRGGLRQGRAPVAPVVPVDVTLTEMLATTDDGGDAYLTVTEISESFGRVREHVRVTHVLKTRHRSEARSVEAPPC
ncbi:MAG: hypothetical protein FWD18_03665 [Micrococcales bacterium]|nr:hypothetical protein [Micrococcales bacterium]